MKGYISILLKKPFVRSVMVMFTGTVAAQAITMALIPLITRLYGPEVYGLMGVFVSIISIITPVAALSYPISIVLPKSDMDAKKLIRLSLYISGIFAIGSGIILLLLHQPIVKLFKIGTIAPYLYLIPLVVLFAGLVQVVEQWLIRKRKFKITAKVTFLQALILQGSKVGMGIFYPFAGVLITITALGNALKSFLMIIMEKSSHYQETNELDEESKTIKELAREYKDFPLYRAPQVFLNAITQGLPILILVTFFGPASAGFYSVGKTVLDVPSRLIGKAIGDVFYPHISEAANNGKNLTQLIKKATTSLLATGVIPFGIIILFGPWLFGLVFGDNWMVAGEYARWTALWAFIMFVYQPCIRALPVLNEQALHLYFTIISLVTRVIALAVGYYVYSSDVVAVALFGVTGAILNIILILITLQKSKNFDKINH
ncbi:lipopolysaccharide biosynthesis protein [Halobacillus sp. MO56]